jgi:hypothetical protein
MTRTELINKIRELAKKTVMGEPSVKSSESEKSIYFSKFSILDKFPDLDTELNKLLTPQYGEFIKDIDWVAPRPTTFRIKLNNEQYFYLIYGEKSWTAQIEGKKYWLTHLPEEQRAAESLARVLRYGGIEETKPEQETPSEPPTPPTSKDSQSPSSKEEPPIEINPEEFEETPEETPEET